MPGSGGLNQIQSKAVIGALQHAEGLAVAQITENVHGKIVAPVGHVPRLSPSLRIAGAILKANLLAEGADIVENVPLHLLHGALGKGMRQDTALAGVDVLVAGVVGVGDGMGKGVVELGLADVGLEAVDVLERLVGAEGEGVGAVADDLACV